jgi:siroheme synthase (precorrin-2 oxidase/ferrochelatase)
LEEKIKTLKKRNAELAAIARRLEEKAKHLQQENMKVRQLATLDVKVITTALFVKNEPSGEINCNCNI